MADNRALPKKSPQDVNRHFGNHLLASSSWKNFEAASLKCILGSRDGAVVRALASHRCGTGSILGLAAICGLSCCWFSSLLQEVFLRVLRFSPLLKNQHFQILIRSRIQWTNSHSVEVPLENFKIPNVDYLFFFHCVLCYIP